MSARRILIAGVPRSGKTTLARQLASVGDLPVRSTDDFAGLPWSEQSTVAAGVLGGAGVVEGVTVTRALRKWLRTHPEGAPCDELHFLDVPREELSRGQAAMAEGCRKSFRDVRAELIRRGVTVVEGK